MTWLKRNAFEILDVLKFLGIILLVFMFIHFNTAVASQAKQTQVIASSTNRVVKSQGDILKAIKQVTTDGNLNSAQQTSIIICMLQVPVQSRTTDLQAQCRSQAVPSPTDSPAKTATPVATPSPTQNPATPAGQGSGGTKSEQAPPAPTTLDKLPLVGGIFKAVGL